jgi:hypothetical protein
VTITPGGQRLRLTDTGKGADIAAGDGIYSASWTPCATGAYTFDYSNGSVDTTTVTGLVPCIQVSPHSGPPGSSVRVTGTGFSPNESVQITFEDRTVGRARADATGAFSRMITVPSQAQRGAHTITAVGAVSVLATQAAFRVT